MQRAEKIGLTERDREICAAIGPVLKEKGQVFVGIEHAHHPVDALCGTRPAEFLGEGFELGQRFVFIGVAVQNVSAGVVEVQPVDGLPIT